MAILWDDPTYGESGGKNDERAYGDIFILAKMAGLSSSAHFHFPPTTTPTAAAYNTL